MQKSHSSEPTLSIRLVWPFLAQARARGRDVDYVAGYLGLTQDELNNPETRVSPQQIIDILNEAIRRSGNRDIGLIAATYVDTKHLGIADYIARSQNTQRESFQSMQRYLPLLGYGNGGYSLDIDGKLARWRFWVDPQLQIHEAAYEFVMALGVLRGRRLSGIETLAPLEVHFMHTQPASTALHDKIFACPIRFGAENTQIVMPAKFLDTKLSGADPVLSQLLSQQADRMLASLPRNLSFTGKVEVELSKHSNLRELSADHIAHRLGVSARTLHRKLDSEGTSYRALFNRVLTAAALYKVERTQQSFSEIAHALGFASQQSFHRAFRRWTGTTPGNRREAVRSAAANDQHRPRRLTAPTVGTSRTGSTSSH